MFYVGPRVLTKTENRVGGGHGMRRLVTMIAVCFLWPVAAAIAHSGHEHPQAESEAAHNDGAGLLTLAAQDDAARPASPIKVSGQGALKFRVLYTSAHLPAQASSVIKRAHGGFAVDRREGRGEIYFALPEAGILRISADFERIRLVNTPQVVREANMHNTTIWYDSEETGYLIFPANGAGKVFTTSLEGALRHTLDAPTSNFTFGPDAVNVYFSDGGAFVPTDVEYVGGTYFVTTGYSKLDYVLTAKVSVQKAAPVVSANWRPLAFGGKGSDPGQFGTGHGVTLQPDGTTLIVADRPNSELERFSLKGEYSDVVKLPEGSFPCDVDFEAGYALVGCLHGPDRTKGAPIYILKDDLVVSTIMPKEDLGLANFQHIHNAVLVEREGKLYIIAQAWNPGDFAILEQVVN